jgi:hypothetical protein
MQNFIDWLTDYLNVDNELPFQMSKEDVIIWVKRIHNNILSDSKKKHEGKHYGDCTKQNVSCEICLYQSWLEDYEDYCRSFNKE